MPGAITVIPLLTSFIFWRGGAAFVSAPHQHERRRTIAAIIHMGISMSAYSGIRQLSPLFFSTAMVLAPLSFCGSAFAADTPFIDQIPSGLTADIPSLRSFGPTVAQWLPPKLPSNSVPPTQLVAPHLPNANLAQILEIGSHNTVIQGQDGIGDVSNVGIIGGNANNVFIGQDGNDLRSNVLLIGTNGMNVGVLEPNGSPPVDLAIIRARNGTIIIPR
jgi:hypothetical protein